MNERIQLVDEVARMLVVLGQEAQRNRSNRTVAPGLVQTAEQTTAGLYGDRKKYPLCITMWSIGGRYRLCSSQIQFG